MAGVIFSDFDSAPVQKLLNPGPDPAILQIWESDSYSDSGYNNPSNRNLPMCLPKKWPHRLLLLPKWKSDSGSVFIKTSCEVVLHIWRWCNNMLCKKQPAIIIINNKQSNLLLKNWLRLHSGPSLKKSTPAPLLFSKIFKTPAGVHSDTPAPIHLW